MKNKCSYRTCNNDVVNSNCCILHLKIPEQNNPDYDEIIQLKDSAVRKKIFQKKFDFEGVILDNVEFYDIKTKDTINFKNAVINNDLIFASKDHPKDNPAEMGNIDLRGAFIGGNVSFYQTKILGDVYFGDDLMTHYKVKVGGDIDFSYAELEGEYASKKLKLEELLNLFGQK